MPRHGDGRGQGAGQRERDQIPPAAGGTGALHHVDDPRGQCDRREASAGVTLVVQRARNRDGELVPGRMRQRRPHAGQHDCPGRSRRPFRHYLRADAERSDSRPATPAPRPCSPPAISDNDAIDPPDQMLTDYSFGFTVQTIGGLFEKPLPWNKDVSALPPSPRSAAIIAALQGFGGWGNGNKLQIDFSIALLNADGATPRRTITAPAGGYCYGGIDCDPLPIQMPIPTNGNTEGSADYTCDTANNDCHVLVVEHTEKKLYELYHGNGGGQCIHGLRCIRLGPHEAVHRRPARRAMHVGRRRRPAHFRAVADLGRSRRGRRAPCAALHPAECANEEIRLRAPRDARGRAVEHESGCAALRGALPVEGELR